MRLILAAMNTAMIRRRARTLLPPGAARLTVDSVCSGQQATGNPCGFLFFPSIVSCRPQESAMAFAEFPVQSDVHHQPARTGLYRGKGSWLTDHNGKRYLDFVQGWAVNALGHSNEGMIDAQQARKLINPSPAFYNEPMLKLARLLTANRCFDRVFFANSGAEANEGAIKLARKWGRKAQERRVRDHHLDHSFHGRTLATMSRPARPAGTPCSPRRCRASQGRPERPGIGGKADRRQDRGRDAGAGAGRRRRDPRHREFMQACARWLTSTSCC
jgi:hypothetical protein